MDTMKTQRFILGVLCACLAPASIVFGLFGDNLPEWYKSISATYYANSKMIMIGLLFATGVFFFSYKGYDWRDRVASIVQAISSWGIIAFPCSTPGAPERVGLFNLPINQSHIIHCSFAALLFISFAANIGFLFTLGDTSNELKKKRNIVYQVCALTIIAFCVVQAISSKLTFLPKWFPTTWLNEMIMLEAFAVAWLTKSGLFFAEKK